MSDTAASALSNIAGPSRSERLSSDAPMEEPLSTSYLQLRSGARPIATDNTTDLENAPPERMFEPLLLLLAVR